MIEEITKVVSILNQGGVILYPTDTIWGLGCDATNEAAVQRIFSIKRRAANKSMIVLLPDEKSILKYVANPHPDIIDFLKSFHEPTTVIYDNGIGFASNVLAADGSIGIRVTKDPFCKMLLKKFNKPIVSTSANISGYESPKIFFEIPDEVKSEVDYVVEHRHDDNKIAKPSSIVKIDSDGQIIKIR